MEGERNFDPLSQSILIQEKNKANKCWKLLVVMVFVSVIALLGVDFVIGLLEEIRYGKNTDTFTWAFELGANILITLALGLGITHIRKTVNRHQTLIKEVYGE